MAVPKYHEFMKPLLKLAGDRKTHSMSEALEVMAGEFSLSKEDRKELLPSGQQYTFDNRVGWARTYLQQAGLLESRQRGTFFITERGLSVLKEDPPVINSEYLAKYPEFKKFKARPKKEKSRKRAEESEERTPKELIEESFLNIHSTLREELLDNIKSCSDAFFERLVVDLLIRMGYGGSRADAGKAIGRSGDHGIDGIINEDKLGLDVIYLQAKKWKDNTVGEREIRDFLGSLELKNAHKGVFITTSSFSDSAKAAASRATRKVILIDGERLTNLMIEYDLAVSTESTYQIKRIDGDYFQ